MSDLLTLCATSRLAQTWRATVPGGQTVWRTPAVLTPGQWFASLADEALVGGLADLPVALDPYAERLLWEKVIAASLADAAALFDIQGLAASAAEAQALCRVWGLQPGAAALSDETRQFVAWQGEFERRCRVSGWIDAAGLQRQLIRLIANGQFALPRVVHLLGFDRPTPLERDLVDALTGRGVAVEVVLPEQAPAEPHVFACADLAAECAAVVDWVQARRAANPACRLGVVAPDLGAVRERLAYLLDDVLHPSHIRPDLAEAPRVFNFSLGYPLADQPVIRMALDLLTLGSGRAKLEQSRLSALLLGAYWAGAEAEADRRASLDALLRRDLPYFTTLPALLALAARQPALPIGGAACPQTVAALGNLAGVVDDAPRRQRPSQWAPVFQKALVAAGWPGERPLSSQEYQAWRAFGAELDGLGRLDALLGTVSYAEAVSRLGQLCRQRVFQPETRGQPEIQVLGVLESAGLNFDALWVMGMNDDRWPPPPRPNPLLPAELQRAAGSAHASAEVELDFARRVHARLLRSAPDVSFSWSQADGNRILRPSPLLGGASGTALSPPPMPTLARRLAADAPSALDRLSDALAPPVAAGESVSGGSWLLRAQAICPAWAYFQYRLGAQAMESAVEGLDPRARGTLVHGVLEAFWTTHRSSDALAALGPAERQNAIAEAVETALATFEHETRSRLPTRFRALEAVRLAQQLDRWLAVEAGRDQPFTVLGCEQEARVEIEGIAVKMVVDRIDQLADGRQVIIDYKTGARIDIRNWAEDRITEPQLPIYAALVNQEVAAVVFAKVRPDQPGFAGVAEAADLLPGVQGVGEGRQKLFDPLVFPDWASVVAHWDARLHAVAAEVRAGRAGVVLADESQLRYCDVLPLLRLPERRRLLAEAGVQAGGSALAGV